MVACPNKTLAAWKNLSSAIGEDNATFAFIRNNNEIPESVAKARELITNVSVLKKLNNIPMVSEESIVNTLQSKNIITGESRDVNGVMHYAINEAQPTGKMLENMMEQYGSLLTFKDAELIIDQEALTAWNNLARTLGQDTKTINEHCMDFLNMLGVKVQERDDIIERYGSNGIASFADKMILIQSGMTDVALPEEALHFFLDVLDQTNPALLEALDKVRELPIYKQTLAKYQNNPNYLDKDGQIRFDKIRKEALAKHLAELMKSQEKPKSVYQKIIDAILSFMGMTKIQKTPYDILIDIMKQPSVEMFNMNLNSTEIYNQLTDEQRNFYNSQNANEAQKDTITKVLAHTAKVDFKAKDHILSTIDPLSGTPLILKGATSLLGSDFTSDLEDENIMEEIVLNFDVEFSGLYNDSDSDSVKTKKIIDALTTQLIEGKIDKDYIINSTGDEKLANVILKAVENKRKTLFGTAIHSIVENLIFNAGNFDLDAVDPVTGKPIVDPIVYNFMDRKTLEKVINGTLNEPGIVGILRNLKNQGAVIMSEITIGNNKVGGIADILAVMPDGSVKIYDFKTKYLREDASYKKFDNIEDEYYYVTSLLSSEGVKPSDDVLPDLVGNRRAIKTKHAQQLSIYKKVLMEAGIRVGDMTIIAIPYKLDPETNKVHTITAFETKPLPFNDKIATGYFSNIDENNDANKKPDAGKIQDDRIKYLAGLSKQKLKEAFVQVEARLEQMYDYFRKNKQAKGVYNILTDEKTKLNKIEEVTKNIRRLLQNFEMFDDKKTDEENLRDMLTLQKNFLDMIDSAGPIIAAVSQEFEKLRAEMATTSEASAAQITSLMKIRDFVVGYKNMFDEILGYMGTTDPNNLVVARLNQLSGAVDNITNSYKTVIFPHITNIMSSTFSPELVDNMRREYNELILAAEQRNDKARAEELKKERDELPSAETIADVLRGNKGDIGWFYGKFLPAISNPDVLVAGIAKRIKATLDRVRLINKEWRDRLYTEFEKRAKLYGRGLNLKDINESLVYITDVINPRTGEQNKQMFFKSEFDEKLYFEHGKLVFALGEAEKTNEEDKIKKAKKDLKDFELKYFQSEFTEEFYRLTKVLDTEVNYQNKKQSVREIVKNIFDRVEDVKSKYSKDQIDMGEMSDTDLKEIQLLWGNYYELMNKKNLDGTAKTGANLKIAEVLIEYNENNRKMYEYIELTDAYENQRKKIELKYGLGSPEYEKWIANNTRLVVSDEFYSKRKELFEQLAALTKNPNADEINELYQELSVLTKQLRDKDNYIKGNAFKAETVARIKEIETQIASLREGVDDYTSQGFTREESNRLKELSYSKKTGDIFNYDSLNYRSIGEEMSSIYSARDERLNDDPELKARIEKIGEILKELSSMTSYEKTKYYEDELENQERLFAENYIDENGNKITFEDLKTKSALYEVFKQTDWYQNNHIKKTTSRFSNDTGVVTHTESYEPIYIWKRNTPVDKYILQKPGRHFTRRSLKETYTNDKGEVKRLKNSDNRDGLGRLKPKTNAQYRQEFGNNHPFLNKEFIDLRDKYNSKMGTDKEKVDYENLLFIHKETLAAQEGIERQFRLGLAVPFMEKELNQQVVESGGRSLVESGKNLWETTKRKFTRTEADMNEGIASPDTERIKSKLATVDNDEVRFVPVRFASTGEVNNQSYDVWGSLLNYVGSINRKKELETDLAFVNGLEELLGDKANQPKSESQNLVINNVFKRFLPEAATKKINLGGGNTRLEVIKSFINSVFYNEEYFEGYDVLGVNTQKTVSRLMSLNSITILGFAPFNWTVNWLSGNVQNMIEAVGGNNFSFRDFLKAKKIIYTDSVSGGKYGSIMGDMMADYSKVGNKSFWGQIMEVFDPIQGEFENEFGQKTSFNKYKNILSLGMFAGKVWGEWEIQMSGFIAFGQNIKLYNGKMIDRDSFITMKVGTDFSNMTLSEVSKKKVEAAQEFNKLDVTLFDILHLDKDGKLGVKDEYKDAFELGSKQFSDIIGKLHSMQKRINGSYAKFDQAYVQKTSLGRMMFFFRKYFIQLGMNRWGQRRPDYEGMSVEQGFYLTFYQTIIKDMLKFRFNVMKNWSNYSDSEKRAIKRTLLDFAIIAACMLMTRLLFGFDPNDKDRMRKLREKSWGAQAALFALLKVRSETEQFTPSSGLDEITRIYTNPSLIFSEITQYIKLVQLAFMHAGDATGLMDYETSLYYQHDVDSSGLKDEGDAKFLAVLAKTLGYSGKTFNPDDAIKGYEYTQNPH
jgi:hypothetical protein